MNILTRDDLPLGGFAGLRERLYVMSPKQFGQQALADTHPGLGNLVYLADAFFRPHGSTGKHFHRNIDIVTCLIRGRLLHQGSLGDGEILEAGAIQIQQAGETGFDHNEINPDSQLNHMIQLWLRPEQHIKDAGYRTVRPVPDARTRIYGSHDTVPNSTWLDILISSRPHALALPGPTLGYLVRGSGELEEAGQRQTQRQKLAADTLFTVDDGQLQLEADSYLILAGSSVA